jgi:4-hydroxy-tetrahydrodipicolinate synthase
LTDHGLTGVIAAVPTPVGAYGEPDTRRFLDHCHWALANGCDALNVLGTTGEASSLSAGQRKTVMRAAAGLDRSRLMVGTGTPDLATTIELTRFAHELGFAAALVLPPYYYKPVTDEGLFAFFSALVAATRDALIAIFLYNFPQLTGLRFEPAFAARLAINFPERVRGAKDSSGDLAYAAELARIPVFKVFPSSETALARANADGYAGCISATVNINAPVSQALWRAQGDAAILPRVTASRQGIAAHALAPAVKYLVGKRLGDNAWERVLPPHIPLTAAKKSALDSLMA